MATSLKSVASPAQSRSTDRGASRRLAKVLREQLIAGEFEPGDRLPTHRQLMERFHVGYSVANRAMEILVRDGLIDRRQGQGSFVREKPSDRAEASRLDAFALVLGHSRWSFYPALFQGLDATAAELHLPTIVCDSENDVDHQAAILMELIDKRVAGIAMVPTTETETPGCHVRLCQQNGIPVVLLHRNVKGVSAPVVALPFEEIGYRAGRALVEQGHRRVACVFDQHYIATEQYEAGLRRALVDRSRHTPCAVAKRSAVDDGQADGSRSEPATLSVHYSDRRPIPMTPEHEKFLDDMLGGILGLPVGERPTGIVAIADDDAEWIYVRLIKMGVRVPEEMSLVTIGSSQRRRALDQQLSAVTIDEQGVGQLAARLLSEMGNGRRPIDSSERFTAKLGFHAGRTLGPAPRAAAPATND